MKPKNKAFTLIELMMVVLLVGILSLAGALRFKNTQETIKLDMTKAKMKAVQIAIKMYFADVGQWPVLLNTPYSGMGRGVGNNTTKWMDYFVYGVANSTGNAEDVNEDGKIDGWNGPYLQGGREAFQDAWEHRFDWSNYPDDDNYYSAIISQGPKGNPDGSPFRSINPITGAAITSEGWNISHSAIVKDQLYPPDEEGFSIVPLNNDPENLETDYIIILWLE